MASEAVNLLSTCLHSNLDDLNSDRFSVHGGAVSAASFRSLTYDVSKERTALIFMVTKSVHVLLLIDCYKEMGNFFMEI